jgi:hypothetical protein
MVNQANYQINNENLVGGSVPKLTINTIIHDDIPIQQEQIPNIANGTIKEFMEDRFKDNNLNLSNIIEANKNLTRKINPIINPIKINEKDVVWNVVWNVDNNCFDIMENDIKCSITNDQILKSIINVDYNDSNVKKYIFIAKWNNLEQNYEFNFINSIFTNNFDIMIKLQNFIYDTINNFDNLHISDSFNYRETIITFFFQLIIFLFNNVDNFICSVDSCKLSKLYSCITYRFSSIILKSILKINNDVSNNNDIMQKFISTQSNILSRIISLEKNIASQNNSENSNESIKSSESSELSLSPDTFSNNSSEKYEKIYDINNYLSDDIKINTDTDSDQNGYMEISDTINELENYSKFTKTNKIGGINPIENSFSFHNSNPKISVNSRDPSFNGNSARSNGKIYNIKLSN